MTSTSPAPAAGNTGGKNSPTVASNPVTTTVDIQQLAEKVYKLMLADVSIQIRRIGEPR